METAADSLPGDPRDEAESSDGLRFPDLRANFIRHLSICRNEDFLRLVFAQNALQLGQTETARLIFRHGYPAHFVNAKLPDTRRANEWELETVVNELLAASSSYRYVYAKHPRLNDQSSMALAHIVNILRDLENEEYSYHGHDIRYELRRVINRQFEWQRGFFNKALAYRTAVMYGGPECGRFLQSSLGVTLEPTVHLPSTPLSKTSRRWIAVYRRTMSDCPTKYEMSFSTYSLRI